MPDLRADQSTVWDAVDELVKSIRMPPGFTLKLMSKYDSADVVLTVLGTWVDSHNPGQQTTTYKQMHMYWALCDLVPELWEHAVVAAIDDAAQAMWTHEFDEWFTVRGIPVRDPHPDGPFTFSPRSTRTL